MCAASPARNSRPLVGGYQGQVCPAGLADEEDPHRLGAEHPVPQATALVDRRGVGAAVAGHRDGRPGAGGELVGGVDAVNAAAGSAPSAAHARRVRRVVQVGVDFPEGGVPGQRPGERDVDREAAQCLADVGAVGDHVNEPVGASGGDQLDQITGQRGFGRCAWAPQPRQRGQRHRSVEEQQRDDDRGDDEGVAPGEFVLALGDLPRPVIRPARGMNFPASAAEQCVVDGDLDRGVEWQQPAHDQLQQGQAELIRAPAGGGEKPMRPAVMPDRAHTGGGEHRCRKNEAHRALAQATDPEAAAAGARPRCGPARGRTPRLTG